MRFGRRLAKILIWALALSLTLAAAATWFAYAFVTDSDTATRFIQAELAQFLPDSEIEIGKVDVRPLRGKLTITNLVVRQRIDGESFTTLHIPWLSVRLEFGQLLQHKLEAREVSVVQPTLKLRRSKSGVWNVQHLLVHPWPVTVIENPPPIEIRNGKVELVVDEGDELELPLFAPDAAVKLSRTAGQPSGSEATAAKRKISTAILRDVSLRIDAADGDRLKFDGSAAGDTFNRIALRGEIDPITGEAVASGGLNDLTLSDTLRKRLPAELAPSFDALALSGGDLDVELKSLAFNPDEKVGPKLKYDVDLQLRGGVCACPNLPFPINDLSARLGVRDGILTINHAEGYNGSTRVRAEGTMTVGDAQTTPMSLHIEVFDLELDQRLKDQTPEEYLELWDVFKPKGRVSAQVNVVREQEGGPIDMGATVYCRDVSTVYRHFAYPLKNLNGSLVLKKNELLVDLRGPIGDKPARMHGKIIDPGPDAVVNLDIEAESVPIDAAFLDALPPEVRPWVDRFKPKGSVKATAHVFRKPLVGVERDLNPEGEIIIDAVLDLDGRCEITWDELPYPVRNLSGTLELHPDLWEFKNMRGRNGQTVVTGSGRVEKLPGPDLPNGDPPLKIDLDLTAGNLPFNDDLRRALPEAWQKSWAIINPTGASDIQAKILIEPKKPESTHITISPLPESGVRLVVPKAAEPGGDPDATIELRMENALGRFDFDNGVVTMRDVNFKFHGAPIQFAVGQVKVEDSGKFDLAVNDLSIKAIRLDSGLRTIMPSLMAQFAIRLDDGRPFTARGNLQIGWSGVPNELAWCQWDQTRVVFVDNKIQADIPLEHINGQLHSVRGRSDGKNLEVHGIMNINSVSVAGLQITELNGPIEVKDGKAQLKSLKGKLLGGDLYGDGSIMLDDNPRYNALLKLTAADLQEYARSLPGRQSFRGVVNAAIEISGRGSDVRTMQGRGEGHISEGDLGQLPAVLRLAKVVNSRLTLGDSPRGTGKSAFDSADLEFRIVNGLTNFDQIKLTGTAFSLKGTGTRDPLDNLDLRLDVLYGRDRFNVPVVSDLLREASGQLMIVRIQGTATHPQVKLEVAPQLPRLGARRTRD